MKECCNKYISIMIALICILLITGCGNAQKRVEDDKLLVYTSFYPLYDFANKIGGKHVQVINLVPAGVDPHDWVPKPRDITGIMDADVFIYNGLGFEGWVEQFLSGLGSDNTLLVVEASEGISALSMGDEALGEEDGVWQDNEHEHHHRGLDPHVWLSPLQAMQLANNIKDAFISADATRTIDYEANYETFIGQLQELHQQYEMMVNQSYRKSFVVSHEAYGYLARDYGLQQIGIMGFSPNAEPTVQTMKQIINFIKEHDVNYILFEALTSPKLAQTIAKDTGSETLIFDTLEGLTDEQIAEGEDYITIMTRNLLSLEKALQ